MPRGNAYLHSNDDDIKSLNKTFYGPSDCVRISGELILGTVVLRNKERQMCDYITWLKGNSTCMQKQLK